MKLNDAVKGQPVNIVLPERGAWTQQFDSFYQLSVAVRPRSLPSSSTDLSATPAGRLEVLPHRPSRYVRSSRKDKIDLKTIQLQPSLPAAVWWHGHACHVARRIHWGKKKKRIISAEILLELLVCLRQPDPVRTDASCGKKGWVFDRLFQGPRRVVT